MGIDVNSKTVDAAARLDLVRNERDALMSFITLLLLPIIHLHGKSVLRSYRLEQSVTTMTKQAKNASEHLLAMLGQQEQVKKSEKKESKKVKDMSEAEHELELYKARFSKIESKNKDLQSELEQTKQKLTQFEQIENVVKKKS